MADLITHGCAALLWKAATTAKPHPDIPVFVAGTCLPDLVGRVPPMGLSVLRWSLPWIPEPLIYLWTPAHLPIGMVFNAALFAMLFEAPRRAAVFKNLLGGSALHLAVDLLQSHFGVGYLLLFPFSLWDWELGWIGSEDTVRIVPILLPLTALICWRRWRRIQPPSPQALP